MGVTLAGIPIAAIKAADPAPARVFVLTEIVASLLLVEFLNTVRVQLL